MKSITINGSQRESVGKKATKALRNAGQVPCVLYGGDKPVHFNAEELAFSTLVYTPNAHTVVIALENGTKFNAILQDIQFHPVTDKILHVDFYQLFEDKEITMEIPLVFVGNSRGVKNGGVLRKNRRSLRVKALPANLPDFIEVNINTCRTGLLNSRQHIATGFVIDGRIKPQFLGQPATLVFTAGHTHYSATLDFCNLPDH